jgi:hypothetical protein
MGRATYRSGFQVTTDPVFPCGGTWTWAWHIANDYRTFTAYVGLGSGDTQPAILSFPGPSGKPLTFRADGYLVKQALLVAGLPTKVSINVAGAVDLVVETTTSGATIDFGNDALTPIGNVFASPPASGAPLSGAEPGGRGWTADATRFVGRIGKLFTYVCPANGTENTVWGTTIYTDDSSVCTAAVNYGLVTVESGGTVTIEMLPGLASYSGSNRNGTTTDSWAAWGSSFVFIGQPIHNTDVGYGGTDLGYGGFDWGAAASDFRGQNGQRYLYICSPGGSPGYLWGTGTYTDDSSVCTAAVQQGLITLAKGGYVTIEIQPGANSYTGSTKNGITSSDWGSWSGSYTFVTR